MKANKKLFFLILFFFIATSIFTNPLKADNNYVLDYIEKDEEIITTTKHAELHIEKDYIDKEEIYNAAGKIEQGIRDLKDYLGEDYTKYDFDEMGKIEYIIKSGDQYSNTIISGGRIRLYHVHLNQSPYIHVTARLLLDEDDFETPKPWLNIGMANYLGSILADYPADLIGNKNSPDKLAKEIIKDDKYKTVIEYFPERYYNNSAEKWAFAPLAGSFVKFIENKYGKEKLLKLYQARRQETDTISALEESSTEDMKSVEQILGSSLKELKTEWLDGLQ
jgi:hypothetical protein